MAHEAAAAANQPQAVAVQDLSWAFQIRGARTQIQGYLPTAKVRPGTASKAAARSRPRLLWEGARSYSAKVAQLLLIWVPRPGHEMEAQSYRLKHDEDGAKWPLQSQASIQKECRSRINAVPCKRWEGWSQSDVGLRASGPQGSATAGDSGPLSVLGWFSHRSHLGAVAPFSLSFNKKTKI